MYKKPFLFQKGVFLYNRFFLFHLSIFTHQLFIQAGIESQSFDEFEKGFKERTSTNLKEFGFTSTLQKFAQISFFAAQILEDWKINELFFYRQTNQLC
jgi:hypothetical protein